MQPTTDGLEACSAGCHRLELQATLDEYAEPAPDGLLDADRRVALVEAALQQHEPALEVVAEVGQLERGIEPHLLVRELVALLGLVLAEHLPQDPTRHALDEVVAVEERAAVNGEEAHLRTRPTDLRQRRL